MARPKEFEYDIALDKAVKVFWEKGYEATSIQDLVEHMEINRASLYDTFGNKQQLFLNIIDRYGQLVVEKLLNILDTPADKSVKTSIKQFFSTVVVHITTAGPLRGCLILNSAVSTAFDDPVIAKKIEAVLVHIEDGFYNSLLQAQKTGQLPKKQDIRALARYFTSCLQGLLVIGRVRPEEKVLSDIINTQLLILD